MVMGGAIDQKLKRMPRTVRVGVAPGGLSEFITIQAAIDWCTTQAVPAPSAANPYVVEIWPGVYVEQVTNSPYVSLLGIGREPITIQQVDAQVMVLASNMLVENVNLVITAPAGGRMIAADSGGAVTGAVLRNVAFNFAAPGAFAHNCIRFFNGSTVRLEYCRYNTGGVAGQGLAIDTAASTVELIGCDFAWASATGQVIGVQFAGSVLTLTDCRLHGLGTHLYCTAGIIRVTNSQYRSVDRTGTGNIVDESPNLQDAPWKVHKWNWMTALASADIAIRGTPLDAGSGQVLLEVTDNVAGQEAVETNPEVAGSLGNEFTPARTPRFITQISVDSFDAHVTMFFGLRETLGNSAPAPGEHHAGFDWDGANFRAVNGDGGAQQTTNLTIPSTNAQHQLEVIVIGGVQVEFYIDGVLVHTEAGNIPTAAMDWQHLLETGGLGGGDLVQITVRNGGCQECPS